MHALNTSIEFLTLSVLVQPDVDEVICVKSTCIDNTTRILKKTCYSSSVPVCFVIFKQDKN